MSLPLSVLDLFPVGEGTRPSRAIHESVKFAQRVDELGYTRYWIAEHHNMLAIATSAPEVLIGHIASATRRIRVGAGGIMLPNHTPLRVVEIFRTLEALHPGRIDLGLGRAPGTDPVTAAALRRGGSGEVNEQLAELVAFARGEFPEHHPFRGITAMPSDVPLPPIWMLGSTRAGASLAAQLGVSFAFAGHFAMREARGAIALYRERFRPSSGAAGELAAPRVILAVSVICGENDEHARELSAPLRLAIVRNATGQRAPIASVAEAIAYRYTPREQAIADDFLAGAILGGVERVREGIERVAADLTADEIMISTFMAMPEERLRSYERIAQAFHLQPPESAEQRAASQ